MLSDEVLATAALTLCDRAKQRCLTPCDHCFGGAREFVATLAASGYSIVPNEPTFEMCQAASAINPEGRSWSLYCVDIYRAMLAASKGGTDAGKA